LLDQGARRFHDHGREITVGEAHLTPNRIQISRFVVVTAIAAALFSACGEPESSATPVLTFKGNDDTGPSDIATDTGSTGASDASTAKDVSVNDVTVSNDVSDNSDDSGASDTGTPDTGSDAPPCQPSSAVTDTCDGVDNDCDGTIDEDGCTDHNACTTGDVCSNGTCKPGAKLSCDDNNPCTDDSCDAGSKIQPGAGCLHTTNSAACDDGSVCTKGESCGGGKCVGKPIDCDDKNECTDDKCDPKAGCQSVLKAGPCDDGDPCTSDDTCSAGTCAGKKAPCSCQVDADCAKVDDGDLCNGTLKCVVSNGQGTCSVDTTTIVKCPEAKICTANTCNPKTGKCVLANIADGLVCDDANACTIGDSCSSGVCKAGSPKACDDLNPCTSDQCSAADGSCKHANKAGQCNDNNACTVGDICAAGKCKPGALKSCDDGNPCTKDSCAAAAGGVCQHEAIGGVCDDGDACTTGDKCSTGTCLGLEKPCGDNNPCTTDSCDKKGGCQNVPNDLPCTDKNLCTVGDKCTKGDCKGTFKPCPSDGNPCTKDVCWAASGCHYVAQDAKKCDDGNPCTTDDACKANKCTGKGVACDDNNPCTVDACDASKTCVSVASADGAACDDNDVCTVTGTCKAGKCSGLTAKQCDDSNPCTTDTCDGNGNCEHAYNKASCDDGNKCTAPDLCTSGACKPGATVNCNDGNICATKKCDSAKGCVLTPVAGKYRPPCDGQVLGESCYKAIKEYKSWSNAQAACKNWGGNLASIANATENEFVRSVSTKCDGFGTSWLWIGLNDFGTEGKYVWSDGSKLTYSKWRPGDPNNWANQEDAVAMYRSDGTWIDYIHWAALRCFVCERPISAQCDDGDKCTTATRCQQDGSCKGKPLACNDGNICTLDSCDPKLGCKHAPSNNGGTCAGGGKCKSGVCSAGGIDTPALSCKAIRDGNKAAKTGLHWLDSDGAGPAQKYRAHCDMTYAGGGWTLVMKTSGSKDTFNYDSNWWKTKTPYGAKYPAFDSNEAKLASYSSVPFKQLRLGMRVSGKYRWLVVNYSASSLYAAIADGKYRATKRGRVAWMSLVSGSSLQTLCNREGFNVSASGAHARVRIGIVGNQQNNCSSPDSRLGFGARGSTCGQDNNNTCGNVGRKNCSASGGDKNLKAFGYVFVR